MTLTFPSFNLSNLKWALCTTIAQPAGPTAQANSERDNVHPDRAFLRELMFNNPEAVQSDLGLMAMMTQYPRDF
jgi:hypothetical protein